PRGVGRMDCEGKGRRGRGLRALARRAAPGCGDECREVGCDWPKTQGQFWDVQLAGGQRSISRFALTSQGSPDPQLPMPKTVERLAPLMRLSPPFCSDPD